MFGYTSRTSRSTPATLATNGFHRVRLQEAGLGAVLPEREAGPSEAMDSSFYAPSLQAICANVLAKNFAHMPEVDALRDEHPELYAMVVERLSPDLEELPLAVSVPRVLNEPYWQRCCERRWSRGQLSKFCGEQLRTKTYGWKRLFLEQLLNDLLLSFRGEDTSATAAAAAAVVSRQQNVARTPPGAAAGHIAGHALQASVLRQSSPSSEEEASSGVATPSAAEARALAELCTICRDYVHCIDLPCQAVHLCLQEQLFARLPGILQFRLTYGVSDVGLLYHRRLIGFTDADAEEVRRVLARYASLEVLRLPHNRMSSLHAQAICAGLVENTSLRVLDLASNTLNDEAVAALSVLLCRPQFPLEELVLADNRVGGGGARALAEALAVNKTLRVLNLSLNSISDADGAALIAALVLQPTLRELHLGNNDLGQLSVKALADTLPRLQVLTVLHLSGNQNLGRPPAADVDGATSTAQQETGSTPGGEALCHAIRTNTSLLTLSVQDCGLAPHEVAEVRARLRERELAHQAAAFASREHAHREWIQKHAEERVARRYGQLA